MKSSQVSPHSFCRRHMKRNGQSGGVSKSGEDLKLDLMSETQTVGATLNFTWI